MMSMYSTLCEILGQFLKPGAVLPPGGIGAGDQECDKAFKAIKLLAAHFINLGVMDEAAAMDGSRPLEQLADSSGIAWGWNVLSDD